MTELERRDWRRIIERLEALGITPYRTAERMGIQFIQAKRLHESCKAGRDPRDYHARCLIAWLAEKEEEDSRGTYVP